MRSKLPAITAAACALVLVTGIGTASYRLGADAGGLTTTFRTAPAETRTAAGDADLSTIAELLRRIRTEAVDAPEEAALIEGAIEGMLETLEDPYALYYDAAEFARFNRGLDGSFSGVGLLLEEAPDGPTVVRALPDTPAERAGIETGEIIVSVDGESVRDLPLDAIVERVTGEEGTTVTLGLEGGSAGPREVELTRAQIEAPTVEAELLEDGAGHVQLVTFSQNAAERVRESVEALLEQGANGIILDLRGNPGGLLNEAVDVAGVFVDDELVVTVREPANEDRSLRTGRGGLTDVPLVVLVDAGSASASEIVAAAMQDIGRARIVGETTFGKGTVQTVRALGAAGGVKFTTAEYLTPSGDSIEGVGVEPDTRAEGADAQLAAAQEALRQTIAEAPSR
jgi:carboxyl-terminal processing protease